MKMRSARSGTDATQRGWPKFVFLAAFAAVVIEVEPVAAEDWSTYLHDNRRSGVTSEHLDLPLAEVWSYTSQHAPQPAWPPPANQDYWHTVRKLNPAVTYDRAFHTVAVGDGVYFGSSADDKVTCLDAKTGHMRWSFFAQGPIRLAPVVANGTVIVGSDDGCVYCLAADDGRRLWTFRGVEEEYQLPGNGRMISLWPVRTGVLVNGETVYCCAGLFPTKGAFLCALSAKDGTCRWKQRITIPPQGYVLASGARLFVPTGRTSPAIFDRSNGKYVGTFSTPGGSFALVAEDILLSGPGRRSGALGLSDAKTKETIATFDGLRIIVDGGRAYLLSETELSAFDRAQYVDLAKQRNALTRRQKEIKDQLKKRKQDTPAQDREKLLAELQQIQESLARTLAEMKECFVWKQPCRYPYSLIVADDVVFAGGDGKVAAFSTADGRELWTGRVSGRAYGLAAANGRLLVSTDKGTIHCFGSGAGADVRVVRASDNPKPDSDDDPAPLYARTAEQIIEQTSIRKGYCLVLGCGQSRLACALAKKAPDLRIVGVEEDAKQVAAAREYLDKAGLYGNVAVHHGSLATLPYVSYFANLIISEKTLVTGALPGRAAEVFRVLRPCGGVAYFGQPDKAATGDRLTRPDIEAWLKDAAIKRHEIVENKGLWLVIRRGPLPDGGEWTHLYGNPSNTTCSEEKRIAGDLGIQWFGQPGPRDIIDRHHRPMSSLFENGRVFIPARNRIITIDAYNGSPLWELDVPGSLRMGMMNDTGQMIVTDDHVYIAAKDECWAVDVASGRRDFTLKAPQLTPGESRYWGYIARVGDRLFGSGQKPTASLAYFDWGNRTVGQIEGDFRLKAMSDCLFSMDRRSGQIHWTYKRGVILNSATAIGGGRIYFVESRNPTVIENTKGRIRVDAFCKTDAYLVALDINTGKKCWEQPFTLPHQHILFLSYAEDTLVCVGSHNVKRHVQYGLTGFDPATGEARWNSHFKGDSIGGTHGEQWQHPAIVKDTIYLMPYAFDLKTGAQKKGWRFSRGGRGCGTISASASQLFFRGLNPQMHDLTTDKLSPLTQVNRPGCWVNIIAAGGLVLVPESSSGCTCDLPLQLSIAFAPRR